MFLQNQQYNFAFQETEEEIPVPGFFPCYYSSFKFQYLYWYIYFL